MARLPINITAEWDPQASVWVATTDDIDGLAIEAESLEKLLARLPGVLQDLLEGNHPELLTGRSDIPFEVHASRIGHIALTV